MKLQLKKPQDLPTPKLSTVDRCKKELNRFLMSVHSITKTLAFVKPINNAARSYVPSRQYTNFHFIDFLDVFILD